MRSPQPGPRGPQAPTTVTPGGPQAPTTVNPMGPPPRPPMGQQMGQPPRPPMGQIVTQDRPHERPPLGRRPVKRTGAASYARSLAPLVGMSIVVVVLIAGITAWISSFQEKPAAVVAPRPAAGTTAPAAPFPTSAVVPATPKPTPKPKAVTPKPKAVTPTAVVPTTKKAAPPVQTTKAQPTQPTQPGDQNGEPSENPDPNTDQGGQTCTIFGCTSNN